MYVVYLYWGKIILYCLYLILFLNNLLRQINWLLCGPIYLYSFLFFFICMFLCFFLFLLLFIYHKYIINFFYTTYVFHYHIFEYPWNYNYIYFQPSETYSHCRLGSYLSVEMRLQNTVHGSYLFMNVMNALL